MFRFRLGRIPVEVQFSHLLFSAIFAYSFLPRPGGPATAFWPYRYLQDPSTPEYRQTIALWIVSWVAIIFVSVLIHELGHALISVAFGYRPAIFLTGFGGHTLPRATSIIPWHKDVLLTLAGPCFGLALGMTCGKLNQSLGTHSEVARFLLSAAFSANVYWAALNLVPVLPLDGGRICNAVLARAFGKLGFSLAQGVGLVVSSLLALWSAQHNDIWLAAIFAFLGMRSVSLLAQYFRGDPSGTSSGAGDLALATVQRLYENDRLEEGRRAAEEALEGDLSPKLRSRFHHLLGWIALKEGHGREALDHFSQVHKERVEPEALAAAFSLVGDDERALPLWELGFRKSQNSLLLHEWAGALIRSGRLPSVQKLPGVDLALAYRFAERVFFLRGLYLEAAEAATQALKRKPDVPTAYDAACAYAKAGRPAQALEMLEQAQTLGFSNPEKALADPDLEPLRQKPEFRAWLAHLRDSAAR